MPKANAVNLSKVDKEKAEKEYAEKVKAAKSEDAILSTVLGKLGGKDASWKSWWHQESCIQARKDMYQKLFAISMSKNPFEKEKDLKGKDGLYKETQHYLLQEIIKKAAQSQVARRQKLKLKGDEGGEYEYEQKKQLENWEKELKDAHDLRCKRRYRRLEYGGLW